MRNVDAMHSVVLVTITAGEDWGAAGGDAFIDADNRSCLPATLSALVVGWVRPKDLIAKNAGLSVMADGYSWFRN